MQWPSLISMCQRATKRLRESYGGASCPQGPPNEAMQQTELEIVQEGFRVRRLEMRDAAAVLRGDVATMEKSWAEDLIVNSNNQMTRGRENILRRIRAGDIGTYSTFVREIESVVIHRDAAIVMGLETVRSTSNARLTGETVRRRYMNIWTEREGEWLLTARQATVFCQN